MKHLLTLILFISLTGCATVPHTPSDVGRVLVPGFYHEVARGDTLWDISRMYNVELKKIISANRLPDASKLEVGQLILIPEVRDTRDSRYMPRKDAKKESFIWPVKGTVVSYFGSISNVTTNKGIDIRVYEGADIKASRSGQVTFSSDRLKGYGNTIIIDHLDGFQTVYAYNRENLVVLNQHVKRGEVIAKAGKTGRATTPALHFEIRKEHKPQNPFYYLP